MALPPTPTPAPPMSTSSLPGSMRPFPVRQAPVRPPVLASDILREELAPRAPARRATRIALLVVAAAFLFAAILSAGLGPLRITAPFALEGALATVLVAGVAALVPMPYAVRGVLAAAAGLLPLLLGATGRGPLGRLGDDGAGFAASLIVMGTLLPAALVFRARYRAFRAARTVLAFALTASLPAVLYLGSRAMDGGAEAPTRAIALLGVASALAATLGFMGPETSAGCSQWAAVVVGALFAHPAWRAGAATWSGRDADIVPLTAAAVGQLLAASLTVFALFQLLAAALATRAREVDVHQVVGAGASEPSPPLDREDGD